MSGSTHFEVSGHAAPSSGAEERARHLARSVFTVVSTKWGLTVLEEIRQRPRRFRELKRSIGTISDKVLTQTLRRLERNGMVTRRVIDAPILGVEYALTPLGRSLGEPFAAAVAMGPVYLMVLRAMRFPELDDALRPLVARVPALGRLLRVG